MRIVNKKIEIGTMLLVAVTTSVLICGLSSDKETQLDSVKLKEVVNNEMFAIMLEQDDGTYKESTDNTWPTDMQYNAEKSGCVDINGNKLDGVLNFDTTNNLASVDTTSTSYCYLYFSIPKWCNEDETAAECLLRNPTTSLNNTSIEAGMYRYQGTTADNYVCFGTNSQSDCLENTDKYLYRIIGIDANNQLKLIKSSSSIINSWSNTEDTDTTLTWPDSDLFKSLNGLETDTITPIFIDSSTYDYMAKDSTWYNKIATTSWRYGDTTSIYSYNGPNMYAIENEWTDTIDAKISLMYIHDYYYAYGEGGAPGSYSNAKTAWLFLNSTEWTMSHYGFEIYQGNKNDVYLFYSYIINTSGELQAYGVEYPYVVRPVFFIQSSTKIIKGTGLSTDPFVIN